MRVAVLGCGPAGLVAAHAATMAGCDVTVYSRKRKSEMFGAQYLHAPIPGMTDNAPVLVQVELIGTHEQYRDKVYGDNAAEVNSVSTEDLPHPHDAWNIRHTYDNLWTAYHDIIRDYDVGSSLVSGLVDGYDLVLSTIPAPALCHAGSGHQFLEQAIWALGDAPERGKFVKDMVDSARMVPKNIIVCNGLPEPAWYRTANVFGHTTVEWPQITAPSLNMFVQAEASLVGKPISTDCDCHPEITRLGRYGQWRKGVLVHHVYDEAMAVCAVGPHG